ncbi:hypothetical protein TEA_015303 [Camellia sinensis var. sinensis]|uniref:NB-ARC domain-containing protein n=2 Tax=Camellia sinensis TaxID=4442 RepID=A0A4S4DYB2_CAMSN|nr:hypothetical protein TEA_015303 [Camellia sinensis var. sinensis]
MAEAVVSFAVERIEDLLIHKANLLYGVRSQVRGMLAELRGMRPFLKDADARQDEHKSISKLVVEIREVAYNAEDVIETFVFKFEPRERRGIIHILKRSARIFSEGITLYKLEALMEIDSSTSRHPEQTFSQVGDEYLVGIERDTEILAAQLVSEEAEHCKVVSICGMGGIGKTTLARKVYQHPDVRRRFDAFAWAFISQQWKLNDVLHNVLIQLIPGKKDAIVNMENDRLARKQLDEVQQQKKCLVVLDDVWSSEGFDELSKVFSDVNTKIILTTRNKKVAGSQSFFIFQRVPLTTAESWELLMRKAFPKTAAEDFEDYPRMERLGRQMVQECGGLPLFIIELGGRLRTKKTLNEWMTIYRNYQMIGGSDNTALDVLALSYLDLSYKLKTCFLYLGIYAKDHDIEVDILYQLWMAEGIISREDRGEEETMMDVAERYLGELAERSLVTVEFKEKVEYSTITESKRFKSCRLHGLMLDLCMYKIQEENFFKTIDYRGINNQEVHPSFSSLATSTDGRNSNKIRRLAIYLDENSDLPLFNFKQEEIARPIRAILFFICSYINYPFGEQLIHLCKNSKCLRVIHFHGKESGDFTDGKPKELPKEIGNLVFLRYLGLKDTGFTKLPSSIGNLKYLQTLDLRTTDEISVPNVLWKMESLVHLYLPYYHLFSTEGKLRVDGLSNLETLENFAPDKVDVKGLFELTNLRRLGEVRIQGKQKNLPEVVNYLLNSKKLQHTSVFMDQCDFCSDEELLLLRQLFSCKCLVGLTIIGIIDKLPEYNSNCYQSLASLTLSGSQLKGDPMATLEKMPNLRILILVDAFAGKDNLVFSANGFRQLERLGLHSLEIGEWMMEEGAMPTLSFLSIGSCNNLKMLPDGLRFITTLQELDITEMPEAFKDCLRMVNDKGEGLHKFHIPSVRFS